ncbi:sphingomyelin phosphodiesterase 3-like [Megalops cyprinoides]|uniref:sphingomyelin phosphodiesterase 3-like n=1 Tax=Megalops cyprinoides TaxID=118141 RepID=UPI0018652FCE|nr:sphingomyelin phosphodiesterase 3-like [Megalops cyprinoides]
MTLPTAPFPSATLRLLHALSWALIFPSYWLLDRLAAAFLATSRERRRRSAPAALAAALTAPLYLLLALAALPLAAVGFAVWAPLQGARRPLVHAHRPGAAPGGEWRPQGRSYCFCTANLCLLPDAAARLGNLSDARGRAREAGRRIRGGASRPQIRIYVDSPTNTSISAASFSSLVQPPGARRASSPTPTPSPSPPPDGEAEPGGGAPDDDGADDRLPPSGVRISVSAPDDDAAAADDPAPEPDDLAASRESLSNHAGRLRRPPARGPAPARRRHADDPFDREVSAFFPANLDFLCLQEAFEPRAAAALRRQILRYFPHVLGDVGRAGWAEGCRAGFKLLNSGLVLASRYPVLEAQFRCYPNGRGEDGLAAKGALFVKVQLGTSLQEQRIVGYLACTHLHAIEGDSSVRCEQLDLLLRWGGEFRRATSQPPGAAANPAAPPAANPAAPPAANPAARGPDLVAFDVVLGDLNFDNCSPEDKLEQQHLLFTHYRDPCRLGPGEDKAWALGTLLDPRGLYDEEVSSPESLQKVLENEEARKEYLLYPSSAKAPPNQKGPIRGNGRRVDYILYSEEGLQADWKVEVEEFSFITQLAGLTDHLPVAMRLAVSTGEEEP